MPTPAEVKQTALELHMQRNLIADFVKAIRASIFGDDNAEKLWRAFQIKLARGFLLSDLYGHMDVSHAVRATGRKLETGGPSIVDQLKQGKSTFATVSDALSTDPGEFMTIPFAEALDALRGRIPGLNDAVSDGIGPANQTALQIRGVEQVDAVNRVRQMLIQISGGQEITPQLFMDNLGSVIGQSRANLETIYRTNLNAAFNEGRRRQLDRTSPEVFPLYMLIEHKDNRTRGKPGGLYPLSKGFTPHFQMGGYVARRDDPIWNRIWPPNGYNCRATIKGLSTPRARGLGFVKKDGTISDAKIRQHNGNRVRILQSGQYPDSGFESRGTGSIAA